MQANCFALKKNISTPIPIICLTTTQFSDWLTKQSALTKQWLETIGFSKKPEGFRTIPNEQGQIAQVLFITSDDSMWQYGDLAKLLPQGCYELQITDPQQKRLAAIAWGLGAYQFTRYKTNANNKTFAQLVLTDKEYADVNAIVETIYWVRDLINTPTEDMGPAQLAQAAKELASDYHAKFTEIVGDDLLKQNYPCIHAVGRASTRAPRLIELRWGNSNDPKITLLGKGVCFDSGGLDLKSSSNMLLMKKDMGGAAHALGLARLIMIHKLPVNLRVLIPAVENVVAGNAYKPGDVLKTRKGITVEVGNTDAEGRLVIADAITDAVSEKPELMVDFTTLTGAARVAVGLDIAAMFTNNDEVAAAFAKYSTQEQDPMWRLPLYAPYRKLIDSSIADINNSGMSPYAGAITAALFIQEFVPANIPWVHFDFMAWNLGSRAGRPEGAEVITLRAVWECLREKYS